MVEMFPTRAIKTSDRGNFEFTIFMPCYHRGTRLTMLPTDTFPMSIEHDGSQARVKHGDRNGQYIYGLGISSRPDGLRRRAAPSSLSDSGAGADCRLAATTHGSSLSTDANNVRVLFSPRSTWHLKRPVQRPPSLPTPTCMSARPGSTPEHFLCIYNFEI